MFDVHDIEVVFVFLTENGQIGISPVINTRPTSLGAHLEHKGIGEFEEWDMTRPDKVRGQRIGFCPTIEQSECFGPVDFNETSESATQVVTPIGRVFTCLTRKPKFRVEHRRVFLCHFSRDYLSLRLWERQLPLSLKTMNWFVYQ